MGNITEYAKGFNEGMSDGADRFSAVISLLFVTLLGRILLKYPAVREYVNNLTKYDLADQALYSIDIVAFCLILFIFLVSRGVGPFII